MTCKHIEIGREIGYVVEHGLLDLLLPSDGYQAEPSRTINLYIQIKATSSCMKYYY